MLDYFRFTRTPTYSFLAALPLLVGYEVLMVISNHGSSAGVRVTADVWTKGAIKPILNWFGVSGNLWLGAIALAVGVVIFVRDGKHFRQRSVEKQVAALEAESPDAPVDPDAVTHDPDDDLELRPRYFAAILIESLILAVVLATAVSFTVRLLMQHLQPVAAIAVPHIPAPAFATAAVDATLGPVAAPTLASALTADATLLRAAPFSSTWWQEIGLSLGAGLYEELLFRVILVLAIALPLANVIGNQPIAWLVAVLISGLVFSGIHYIGPYGDPWQLNTFVFRFVFGLALQALMAVRGFAVAAWTHALYDVLVVSGLWG